MRVYPRSCAWTPTGSVRAAAAVLLVVLVCYLGCLPAQAAGHLKVCNRGSVKVLVAEVDWINSAGRPRVTGWYPMDVDRCYETGGAGVDVALAFLKPGLDEYYEFPVPELRNENPFSWSTESAGKVEGWNGWVCVTEDRFDHRVPGGELTNSVCEPGWFKVRFNWRVVVCGGWKESCAINLEIKPTPYSSQQVSGRGALLSSPPVQSAIPTQPASQPPRTADTFPQGSIMARYPIESANNAFKAPGDVWRWIKDKRPVPAIAIEVLSTKSVPTDPKLLTASAALNGTRFCDGRVLFEFTPVDWGIALPVPNSIVSKDMRLVSLQNLDASRLQSSTDHDCTRVVVPCRNDAKCVLIIPDASKEVMAAESRLELSIPGNPTQALEAIRMLSTP